MKRNNGQVNSPPSAASHAKGVDHGRGLRQSAPRSCHAAWEPPANRPDPVAVLLASSKNRLEHLLALRYGRMSQSPFAYMRGAAAMMATDLGTTPTTGIRVQLCGD